MPYPTPTSPTLADLAYNAYNPGGSMNTTAFVPQINISVSDVTVTSDTVAINQPGFAYNRFQEDFVTTSENVVVGIDQFDHNQFSITVSDTSVTSEFMQTLHNGAWDLKTSDSTVTSEAITVTPPA